MKQKNRRGAMEMSVGTIVTIVLLMAVLVMGIYFVTKITTTGSGAIDQVNDAIQSQINQLFTSGNSNIVVYPNSRNILIKRGDSPPKGFAFAVKNPEPVKADFTYSVTATDLHNCGSLTPSQANLFLIGGSGPISLGPSAIQDPAQLVRIDAPTSAPTCTITYTLTVSETNPSTDNVYSVNVFISTK